MSTRQDQIEAAMRPLTDAGQRYAYAYGVLSSLVEMYFQDGMDQDQFATAVDELQTAVLNLMDPLTPEGSPAAVSGASRSA